MAGDRRPLFDQAAGRALIHDDSAVLPGPWPDVDHVVGPSDHSLIVFDEDDRRPDVDELVTEGEKSVDVGAVKPGGGFVEHDAQGLVRRSLDEVSGEKKSLSFSPGQRVETPPDGEVTDPDAVQPP